LGITEVSNATPSPDGGNSLGVSGWLCHCFLPSRKGSDLSSDLSHPPILPSTAALSRATRKGISKVKGDKSVALDFMEKVIYVDYRYDSFQPENSKKTCLECFACPWRPGYGRPVQESKLFEVF
jgi:hypothetical protein